MRKMCSKFAFFTIIYVLPMFSAHAANNVLFADIVTQGNPGIVAAYLDSLTPAPGSGLATVFDALDALNSDPAQLQQALNQLQPSQYGSVALTQQNNAILIRSTFTQRLWEVYPLACNQEWLVENSGSLWIDPVAKYVNQDAQQQNHSYHAFTAGGALGGDYRVGKRAYFGIAGAYTYSKVHMNENSADERINSAYGGVYGTWFNKWMFVDATFLAAYNHYDGTRNIDFFGIDRHAKSKHNGYQLSPSLGIGVLYNTTDYQLQPMARVDYIYTHQSAFKEHGADSIDLKVQKTISQYVRTDVGIKFSQCYSGETIKIIPDLKLAWVWDKQLDDAHFKARFVDTEGGFQTTGMRPVHNLFAPGLGLTIMSNSGGFCFAAYYDIEIGKHFWENRGYLNFRAMF